ncbi:MAG TPA: restriction endonuclease [Arenimonas sp.]|nr:restriction endonuclease [Arenimonas sp.]HOZ05086.1 restriction endonuclease [Arenimonas sp.]HPO23483.1 restriction endonuclease [Arenimonas sp.]HPW31299.1 restriction endonuclease [Arenimonas sp.]
MSAISPILIAIFIGLVCFLLCFWWFGIIKRRQAEIQTGVGTLAAMKWRECVGLVIQSLEKEGYREEISSRQPGDGGTEFLLKKGSALTLLSYKHGTAYHLGEANIRDFANGVQLIGASKGILVTLGTIESMAKDVASRYDIMVIDGNALWPRIEGFLSSNTLDTVRSQASAQTKSKVQLGAAISVAVAVISFFAFGGLGSMDNKEPDKIGEQAKQTIANANKSIDPTAAKLDATAKAMAEVDKLTEAQLAQRKADSAKSIAAMPEVNSAIWYSASTLQLNLNTEKNDDKTLIDQICRILTQHEELRYTRLQLDPPPGSNVPVRFRQCL